MATVWIPQFVGRSGDLAKRWEEVLFLVARQGLAAKLAKDAGLETRYACGEGYVDLEITGPAQKIGQFLKDLAGMGIGRLTVDMKSPQGEAEIMSAAKEAYKLLTFDVVDV